MIEGEQATLQNVWPSNIWEELWIYQSCFHDLWRSIPCSKWPSTWPNLNSCWFRLRCYDQIDWRSHAQLVKWGFFIDYIPRPQNSIDSGRKRPLTLITCKHTHSVHYKSLAYVAPHHDGLAKSMKRVSKGGTTCPTRSAALVSLYIISLTSLHTSWDKPRRMLFCQPHPICYSLLQACCWNMGNVWILSLSTEKSVRYFSASSLLLGSRFITTMQAVSTVTPNCKG